VWNDAVKFDVHMAWHGGCCGQLKAYRFLSPHEGVFEPSVTSDSKLEFPVGFDKIGDLAPGTALNVNTDLKKTHNEVVLSLFWIYRL
jgi:hypothetical protein